MFYPPDNKDKFGCGWKGPYLVVSRLGDVNYQIQREETTQPITVHIDHIKTYTHSDTPVSWLSQGDYRDKSVQVGTGLT